MRTKPILTWPGGKTRLLKKILPLIRPHHCYVEAFAGGLAVFLAREERAAVEVVNDLNSDIVGLYRCAQFHLEALLKEVEFLLYSRENIQAFQEQPGLTDLQRAARFLVRNRTSFGGSGTSFAVSKSRPGISRETLKAMINALSERLDRVLIENAPFERVLKNYDSAESLFFLDPPYVGCQIDNYDAWDDKRMAGFADQVKALKGDWIVTVNDSPANRRLFSGHEIQPVVTSSGAVNRRTDGGAVFGELIIRRKTAAKGTLFAPTAVVPQKAA